MKNPGGEASRDTTVQVSRKEFEELSQVFARVSLPVFLVDRQLTVVSSNQPVRELVGKDPAGDRCYEVFREKILSCENCPARLIFQTPGPLSDSPGPARGSRSVSDSFKGRVCSGLNTVDGPGQPELAPVYPKPDLEGQRLKFLFELHDRAGDVVLVVDRESGCVRDFNRSACDKLGYSPDVLRNRSLSHIVPDPEDRERLSEWFKQPGKEGVEAEMHPGEGPGYPAEISGMDFCSGELIRRVIIARDITARKENEAELLVKTRAMEEFASSAAHDLRTPLYKILAGCELLEDQLPSGEPEASSTYLKSIKETVENMEGLIGAFLRFHRSGSREPELEQVRLNELVDKLFLDYRKRLELLQGKFSRDELPVVEADPVLLEQLYRNLIENALKYSGPQPEIHVGIRQRGIHFVADSGPGVEPENREKIFHPLVTSEKTSNDSHGIGLALVQRIVRRHGGRIWVDTPSTGGARFNFTLASD